MKTAGSWSRSFRIRSTPTGSERFLNVDGQKVADAIDQALEELNSMDQEIIGDNEGSEEWDEAADESRPEPSTPVAAGR